MKFGELLETAGGLPMFRSSLLLVGDRDPADVRRQLSRWVAAGKVIQLRRDVYVLAAPWRVIEPHPLLVANELHRPSYVSLQSALGYHGLIPEAVPVTTSVTTTRPVVVDTSLGRFDYRHVRLKAFFGYRRTAVWGEQEAFVADPAKALLDLVYLTPRGDSVTYLESLRLEGLEAVSPQDLRSYARRWSKAKLERAVENILELRERR